MYVCGGLASKGRGCAGRDERAACGRRVCGGDGGGREGWWRAAIAAGAAARALGLAEEWRVRRVLLSVLTKLKSTVTVPVPGSR